MSLLKIIGFEKRGGKEYFIFVDFTKAFDSVDRLLLKEVVLFKRVS